MLFVEVSTTDSDVLIKEQDMEFFLEEVPMKCWNENICIDQYVF